MTRITTTRSAPPKHAPSKVETRIDLEQQLRERITDLLIKNNINDATCKDDGALVTHKGIVPTFSFNFTNKFLTKLPHVKFEVEEITHTPNSERGVLINIANDVDLYFDIFEFGDKAYFNISDQPFYVLREYKEKKGRNATLLTDEVVHWTMGHLLNWKVINRERFVRTHGNDPSIQSLFVPANHKQDAGDVIYKVMDYLEDYLEEPSRPSFYQNLLVSIHYPERNSKNCYGFVTVDHTRKVSSFSAIFKSEYNDITVSVFETTNQGHLK